MSEYSGTTTITGGLAVDNEPLAVVWSGPFYQATIDGHVCRIKAFGDGWIWEAGLKPLENGIDYPLSAMAGGQARTAFDARRCIGEWIKEQREKAGAS